MNPVLFDIGIIRIYWYSVLIFFAILIGGSIVLKEAKRFNIPENFMLNLFFWIIPVSLIEFDDSVYGLATTNMLIHGDGNSNDSVQKLKGINRPINTQEDRAYILASLESVDYVVIFEEETPYELIKLIQPHTLVKGGDYEGKDVVGQDIVNELKLVQFVDGKSTTKIIQRIQNSATNN
jgi:rfaE bifunctional protein nucleotidyltransferase chain/domain